MPFELVSLSEDTYRKILLLKDHLRHENVKQTIQEIIRFFPFNVVDLMDKTIFDLQVEEGYAELIEKAVKLYCADMINLKEK